mgnify:CR=1 FL=1
MSTAISTKARSEPKEKRHRLAAAAPLAEVKRERLHLRLDLAARNKIEQAAAYLNKTASDFVLSQAVIAADKVIELHGHSITLSDADWERFCTALEHPPKPNGKLRDAARRYARRGGELAG